MLLLLLFFQNRAFVIFVPLLWQFKSCSKAAIHCSGKCQVKNLFPESCNIMVESILFCMNKQAKQNKNIDLLSLFEICLPYGRRTWYLTYCSSISHPRQQPADYCHVKSSRLLLMLATLSQNLMHHSTLQYHSICKWVWLWGLSYFCVEDLDFMPVYISYLIDKLLQLVSSWLLNLLGWRQYYRVNDLAPNLYILSGNIDVKIVVSSPAIISWI